MRPEVTLIVFDEHAGAREVRVEGRRFSIGRDGSNDLVVNDTNLSRRHALVEVFADGAQITDCNSSNGTLLNGAPLRAATPLRDGDRLTLGGTCEVSVSVRAPSHAAAASAAGSAPARPLPPPARPAPSAPPPTRLTTRTARKAGARSSADQTTILAAAGIAVVLLAAAVALFVARTTRDDHARPADDRAIVFREGSDGSGATNDSPREDSGGSASGAGEAGANMAEGTEPSGARAGEASTEQIERHAEGVMRRVSSDDKPYGFTERAIADVARRVGSYRGSNELRAALASLARDGKRVAAAARANDLQPALVAYAALAATDGGRGGRDPAAATDSLVGDLAQLRATFGSNDAEGTLILVAAYTDGTGTKKSHPLLATIRRLVANPTTQRNVWFLHERGGLDDAAYDFVLRFIALGVIAQHPQDYGIGAQPLAF